MYWPTKTKQVDHKRQLKIFEEEFGCHHLPLEGKKSSMLMTHSSAKCLYFCQYQRISLRVTESIGQKHKNCSTCGIFSEDDVWIVLLVWGIKAVDHKSNHFQFEDSTVSHFALPHRLLSSSFTTHYHTNGEVTATAGAAAVLSLFSNPPPKTMPKVLASLTNESVE